MQTIQWSVYYTGSLGKYYWSVCVQTALSSSQFSFQITFLRHDSFDRLPLLPVLLLLQIPLAQPRKKAVWVRKNRVSQFKTVCRFGCRIGCRFGWWLVWQTAITPCVASVTNTSFSTKKDGKGRFESGKLEFYSLKWSADFVAYLAAYLGYESVDRLPLLPVLLLLQIPNIHNRPNNNLDV